MNDRGVPHIVAQNDLDMATALGYAVARDRLFQMDFIHRAATGRLAEVVGPGALSTDQFFYRNGIVHAVRRNTELQRIQSPEQAELADAYMAGVNAWLKELEPRDWPLEYRLIGAAPPDSMTSEATLALYAYMAFDLSFQRSDERVEHVRQRMSPADFERLYPNYSTWERTIVPPEEAHWVEANPDLSPELGPISTDLALSGSDHGEVIPDIVTPDLLMPVADGFIPGKGSNNWAVAGSRSTTGMPILAGDMHLSLTLPAIWYEARLTTPDQDVYGVTFPAVPAIVEGITATTAWTFTNTGSDQLDTYQVVLDDQGERYLFDGEWRALVVETDTIQVKGEDPYVQRVPYTHFGPVRQADGNAYAIRWVGHEYGTTLAAATGMNKASNYEEFELAIRQWDYPTQNILYVGGDSVVAIRSTGYMPIRGQGNAYGVQDGTTSDTEWIGRIPFDELPHVINPTRGYLASTNQRPAPEGYPYYIKQNYSPIYRSIRIDDLLMSQERHTPDDLASYQADQLALQARLFTTPLSQLDGLTEEASRLRDRLTGFDGVMSKESTDASLFADYFQAIRWAVWDEQLFQGGVYPASVRILDLLNSDPADPWFDLEETDEIETAPDVFRTVLEEQAAEWAA